MRTKVILGLAVLTAGVATSMAQSSNVYSLNIVGYVNTTLPAGGLSCICNPLSASTNTIAGLFGGAAGALPEGSQIYLWNGTGYVSGTRDDTEDTGWSPAAFATQDLSPGKGAFVKNGGTAPVTVTFVGEVKTGNMTNSLPAGYSLTGSMVPQAGVVDADLGLPVADGDQIYKWNGTGYTVFTADSTAEPAPWGTVKPTMGVGEGFFRRGGAAADWTRNFTIQ